MKKYSKEENSWIFYDWANSAYSIIITTAVFPLYYKAVATDAGVSMSNSTAYLGYTVAIATFILAMIGPLLGTIADYEGLKKKFFLFFFLMGTVATAFIGIRAERELVVVINHLHHNRRRFSWGEYILRCIFSGCYAGRADEQDICTGLWVGVYREYDSVHYQYCNHFVGR